MNYIEFLFKDSPDQTDLKNEIMLNSLDKFDDMVSGGMSEDDAFNSAVSGIGDISALLGEGKKKEAVTNSSNKPRAVMLAIAVALYILSVVPCIIFEGDDTVAPSLMFAMIAIATGLIIYRSTAYKKYEEQTDAEHSAKNKEPQNEGKRMLKKSVQAAFWMICIAAYFIVSFTTGAWYVTWVIFLIGGAVSSIIDAAFSLRE